MRRVCALVLAVVALAVLSRTSLAQTPTVEKAQASKLVNRGISYLTGAQAEDGSFSKQAGPGITALVATAFLENGRSPSDPVVAKALKYLESHVRPDGGIYAEGSKYKNYETSLAIRLCRGQR